jgi:hypothetical protein
MLNVLVALGNATNTVMARMKKTNKNPSAFGNEKSLLI